MNPTSQTLPNRLSESAFRRYEPFIANAVTSFPAPYIIHETLLPIPINTFVPRLRDAITSLHRYQWSTKINMELFNREYKSIRVVRHDHVLSRVIIGAMVKDPQVFVAPDVRVTNEATTIVLSSMDQKKLIAELASHGLLTDNVRFGGLSPSDITFLEENFDVAITLNVDQTYNIK